VPALDPTLSLIVTLGAALLFGAAAVHKLTDWRRFRAALGNYRLLSDPLVPAGATAVVTLELATCALLLLPSLRPAGAVLAAALLALYATAIGVNLARGRTRIDCGCLGVGRRAPISRWMAGRNLVLAAIVLLAAFPRDARELAALDIVTIACALLSLAALYSTQSVLTRTARTMPRRP
jgi:uncharacterized membrane protein YphA (DoxX/SURF4 family)